MYILWLNIDNLKNHTFVSTSGPNIVCKTDEIP